MHGHSLQARCKDLGLYKLLGETRVLCSNGLWAPRMPSCVPTTLLTNYSGKYSMLNWFKLTNKRGLVKTPMNLNIIFCLNLTRHTVTT